MERRRIEIIIDFGCMDFFQVGAAYTVNDIQEKIWVSPRGLTSCLRAAKDILVHDFLDLCRWAKSKVTYIFESQRVMTIKGKAVLVATFLVVNLAFVSSLKPRRVEPLVHTPVIKDTLKVSPALKVFTPKPAPVKAPVKTKVAFHKPKAVPSLYVSVLQDSVKELEKHIHFNPDNAKTLYHKEYKHNLAKPTESTLTKKFDSYEDGVLYFYYLGKLHNATSPNKINVLAMLFQSGIEMGLRPTCGGYVSTISTYCNNHAGIKTFDYSDSFIYAKDDDKDKKGHLIHSKFKIFSNYTEALARYAEIINAPRYRGGMEVEYVTHVGGHPHVTMMTVDISDSMDDANWKQCIKGLRQAGYCTNDKYVKQTEVVAKEMIPVLKKHGIKI